MKIRYGILVPVFLAVITLAACGGGGGGGDSTPPPPDPDPVVTASPIVSFMQSVPSQDIAQGAGPGSQLNEIFPGQANVWSLDQDFTLVDGFDEQFRYALLLTVGASIFPSTQTYSELAFAGPAMGTAEGVKVAAVSNGDTVFPSIVASGQSSIMQVKTGTYVAFINATSDSRLQQTLDLTSATAPVTLRWDESVSVNPGNITGYDPSFRVVVRNPDGTLLKELFANPVSTAPQTKSARLDEYAGQTIVLSFEEHSSTDSFSEPWAIIDSVSVKDSGGHEYVTNGDFEAGNLNGWTTNTPAELQNVTSGARNLEGLDVKRSFYTVPNKLWGRWVDVFENNTGAAITKTVAYETNLGSDGYGIIYDSISGGTATTPPPKALTSWDSSSVSSIDNPNSSNRDIGLVFGNAASVTFTSDDGTGLVGSDIITVTYNITVPAGGRVAIVNFVIMDGTDTGLANPGTTNPTARATDIDAESARIVSNFWTDPQYRAGMSQQQIEAISNFANVQ